MKFRKHAALAALTTSALVLSVAGPQAVHAKDKDGKILIAVSFQTEQEPIWRFNTEAMKAEAAKQGVSIIFQYADRDPAKQASQVEQMLSQQPDAFILNPVNSGTAGRLVDEIHEAGIPVVAFDASIPTSKTDFLVTRDNYQVGVLQAQEALKFAPSGNYAFIKGSPAWEDWTRVVKGYEDILKGNANIKVVFDQNADWSPAKAQSLTENALSANDDKLAAVVTMNDGMAAGVAQALKTRGLDGKVFVSGLDAETSALKLVASGAQTMTIYTDLNDYASSSVKAAVALAKKEVPPSDRMTTTTAGDVPTHLVPIMAVTKDNLCDAIKNKIIKGWTSVAEVFGNEDACK